MIFYMLGLLALILFEHRFVYPIALGFLGFGSGTGNTIKNAMLAEVYRVDMIGQIRSIFITVMVVSTALGPVFFGVLLDLNISYSLIFSGVLFLTLVSTLNGLRRL
jgi:cyanate permease